MRAYGAEVVLTDGKEGMAGSIKRAEELAREIPNSFIPSQFENENNPKAHYKTTGPEIYEQTDGKIDIFIAGIGTGGTITGVGKYLKEKRPECEIIGVEPADSPLITEGRAGAHKIQGIGANFIPKTLDLSVVDRVYTRTTEQAYDATRELARHEGILVGISSGAALSLALELAKAPENEGKTIAVLLPDGGDKYLSVEGLF
jgi:cysteine synthase A